jgi:hypothetical protein
MPKSYEEIVAHADEIADWYEREGPDSANTRDARELRKIANAVLLRSAAEGFVHDAVLDARRAGHNWSSIGTFLGTSGEAARQKYGRAASMYDVKPARSRKAPRSRSA